MNYDNTSRAGQAQAVARMFCPLRHVWLTGGAPDRWFVIIIKYYVGILVLCNPGSSGTSYSSNHDTQPETLSVGASQIRTVRFYRRV